MNLIAFGDPHVYESGGKLLPTTPALTSLLCLMIRTELIYLPAGRVRDD